MRFTPGTVLIGLLIPSLSFAQEVASSTALPLDPRLPAETQPQYPDAQLIVRFDAPIDILAAASLLEDTPFVVDRELMPALGLYLVLLPETIGVPEARQQLEALAGVRYAVPDAYVTRRETVPNDSNFGQQYSMRNTGQSGGTPDADIDATEAWDLGTGSNDYVIAIVDGGAQTNHTDLLANRWENAAEVNGSNGVDDDGNGYVDDKYGWNAYSNNASIPADYHGTHVAGIAGARGNNNAGVAGVNWTCKLMAVAGASGTTSTVVAAYNYVLTQRDLYISSGGTSGANVVSVNSSFGIDFADCNSGTYQAWNDMYDLMGASGILNAAATINSNQNVDVIGDVPTGCSSDWLISVTNTDRNDNRAFAGYGALQIDLGAPGTDIRSTVPTNGYGELTGTSMATPHVTGAVAFLHSVASPSFKSFFQSSPGAAALELKAIMLANVDVIPSLQGQTVSDGRLNLFKAASAISAWGGCVGGTSTYCQASPNSYGLGAKIWGSGSTSLANNDFGLVVVAAVPNEPGLFYYGPNQISAPFGDGFRCVGGTLFRLNPPVLADGFGDVARAVDFHAAPANAGPGAITAGSTWRFQYWYRDPAAGGAGFNLSDGLEATFCP